MPGMDGFETAQLVRSRDRNRATPIIFITGLSWQDDAVLARLRARRVRLPDEADPPRGAAREGDACSSSSRSARSSSQQKAERAARTPRPARTSASCTTQRQRFEAEVLERQMAQMAEADRRKDEFLAILAHELRNPLQPLQTAVEVLEHDPDKPVPARDPRHHPAPGPRTSRRLVDDLLDVARFTDRQARAAPRAGRARRRSSRRRSPTCRTAIDARKHTLDDRRPTAPPPMVHGDPVRLVQVRRATCSSTRSKYTDPGGTHRRRLGHATAATAFVRVTDNGRGIPAELLPRIFDMFVQERVTPDGAGGLGLGLGLVKRLVELHGGTRARGERGHRARASTFEVRAPARRRRRARAARADAHRRPARRTRPLRAVVCDDAPDLRELVADLLRMRGHEVTVVEDGPRRSS